ncbi:hypothetical protein JRO89_XSUnG0159200 [Xanthoceras sorbifolium]|uniref:DUF1677 family protein n=1 Tax=Xanthoceras sorbifolium TaxID=99658 RepID=A0ABQ8GXU0_9ROSI|nr:hypothetical protein JRO89_XSUnG0159200 [Xanthoceras sorbifolium]
MAISGLDSPSPTTTTTKHSPQLEVESVKCDSCGFTEDCTPSYILRVRERYKGRWLCGLCAEAVKDEVLRSDRLISIEEALDRHISFYNNFRSTTQTETEYPISAMGRILRRSLDSIRPRRSNSTSLLPHIQTVKASSLVRSESCFSALSR